MKSQGLPKRERLVSEKDFQRIFSTGVYFHSREVVLLSVPNQLQYNRVGVVVGKKSFKKSTDRNRLKRLSREFYRKNKSIIKQRGLDIVIMVKKISNIDRLSYNGMELLLKNAFEKAGLKE